MVIEHPETDVVDPSKGSMTTTGPSFDRVKKQFQMVLIGNILSFSLGTNLAWYSPALPVLISDQSPLLGGPISQETAGWIGSVLAVGSACGCFGFGLLANWIGHKRVLQLAALPVTLSWILIIFGNYSWHIGLSRFMCGISGGGVFTCFPQYVAEIASDHVRGQLNSYIQIACYSGILLGYISGSYLPYNINPVVMAFIPIVYFIGFSSMPESPQFLLKCDRVEDAETSLRYYRNVKSAEDILNNQQVLKELDKLKAIAKQNDLQPSLKVSDFVNPIALRALIISPFLLAINQFSGSFVINNYAETIFKSTGSSLDPQLSSIVMGIMQVFGTYTASQLMDRAGRKMLLLVSLSGCFVAHVITGTYSYLAKHEFDVSAFNWVPIVSISSYIFFSSIGILPVPYVMLAETIPKRIRLIGSTFCTSILYFAQIIILRLMPILLNTIDLYGSVFMFAIVCLIGLLFTICVVKETKCTNLDVLEANTNQKTCINTIYENKFRGNMGQY